MRRLLLEFLADLSFREVLCDTKNVSHLLVAAGGAGAATTIVPDSLNWLFIPQ